MAADGISFGPLSEDERTLRAEAFPRRRKRKVRDLVGLKVNDLEVIERAEDYIGPSGNRSVRWLCRCVCGKTCVKSAASLLSGTAKSCGCARRRSMHGKGLIDLTGRTFGRWTVLDRAEDKIDSQGKHWPMWNCRCSCGTERVISGSSLRSGGTLSCGCLKIDVLTKRRDLVGKRFGRLVVLRPSETGVRYGDRVVKAWHCRCDCGNETDVSENSLLRGYTKSCGCLKNSYNEECFSAVLDSYGLDYDTQVSYEDLKGVGGGHLRYDFRIDMGHPVLVELNGAQHYDASAHFGGEDAFAATRLSDGAKLAYAEAKGIPLHVVDCSSTPTRAEFDVILSKIAFDEGFKLAKRAVLDDTGPSVPNGALVNPVSPISDELISQMVDKSCSNLSAHSHRKIEWRCEHGHVWSADVASRTAGAGCPYCSGRRAIVGETDLATLRPDLAMELVRPEEAHEVTTGSGRRLEWRCQKDPSHTWYAAVRNRVGSGTKAPTGCPYCSGHAKRKRRLAVSDMPLAEAEAVVPISSEVLFRLRDQFGVSDVETLVISGTELFHIVSRDFYVADLTDANHGWHWLGEVEGEALSPARLSQMHADVRFRDEMRARGADFVAFWDERLWDMDLWIAMGAPVAHDWERSYSWLSARTLSPLPLPAKRGTSQSFTTIAKHYQHDVIFAREIAMWGDDVFLDKQRDRRRLVGALFANRYRYIGKLPDELSDAEILRGLRIAGYASAYSRYDATSMLAFLAEHADVRRVADPCAGWGERMLACASVGVAYEGVDVNGALVDGYGRMIGELGLSGVSFAVKDAAIADFGCADAVITCPPYLDVETYSENGAENMDAVGFSRWWSDVVARCVASGCRWFCITTNQACRELFASAVVAAGFLEVLATPIGKGHASHFNRKRGGVSTKREFEEFIVFKRNGLGE